MLCFLGGFMFLQSCGDDCDDVTCFNGGTCDDGTCECVAGYTGSTCEDEQRAGLIGTWIGNTICPPEPAEATTIEITNGIAINQILISEEGEESIGGTITGTNTFDIDPFTVSALGLVVNTTGNGLINSSNQIEINFDVEIVGFGSSTCTFTGAP